MQSKNYITYTPLILLSTVAILSFVAPFKGSTIGGVEIKQANIYRDITDKTNNHNNIKPLKENLKAKVEREKGGRSKIDNIKEKKRDKIVAIEDYSKGGTYINQVRDQLKKCKNERFRIAFLGDSYIEGDILTMDLRRKLQEKFGGEGVGFVPITSPVSRYRSSIDHTYSDNWSSENVIKNISDGDYILSGYKFEPTKESFVRYQMSNLNPTLRSVEKATMLYVANSDATVEVEINDGKKRRYKLPKQDRIEALTIKKSKIKSIQYNFENCNDLTLYGVMLDGKSGVSVDNYALRGEIGNLPLIVSKRRIAEFSEITSYKLIVLQYGLNFNYITKEKQFKYHSSIISRGVNKLKECYPNTPIMIMGIGPMMIKDDNGDMVVKPNVYEIEKMLRQIAVESGSMYWSTIDAVDRLGGMELFVKNKWAAKDYTHMTAMGGKKLAEMLYEALVNKEVVIDK